MLHSVCTSTLHGWNQRRNSAMNCLNSSMKCWAAMTFSSLICYKSSNGCKIQLNWMHCVTSKTGKVADHYKHIYQFIWVHETIIFFSPFSTIQTSVMLRVNHTAHYQMPVHWRHANCLAKHCVSSHAWNVQTTTHGSLTPPAMDSVLNKQHNEHNTQQHSFYSS